jgi:hypothetical protein
MLLASKLLNVAGLVAGFVGTLMVARAIGRNPGDAYQTGTNISGRVYLAAVNGPKQFDWGLKLIAFGFALQFCASLYQLYW